MSDSTTRRIAFCSAALVPALGALIALPARETFNRAGQDIQYAGQAGSDAIHRAAGKK
jgi:predicted small secreted protein